MSHTRSALINELKKHLYQELNRRQQIAHQYNWAKNARDNQRLPTGDWRTWLILAGRGYGKTRTGAETVRAWATQGGYRHIALIGQTESEVRRVMVEGQSGLLAVHPEEERPVYESTKGRLRWRNGAVASLYTAHQPEKLRGPQFDGVWIDEFAKFRAPEKLWEQLQFSLRLGPQPRVVITTTPRPVPLLQQWMHQLPADFVLTRGNTFENAAHLSPSFIEQMEIHYKDTRLGQQELWGEMLSATEGALWKHAYFDDRRWTTLPPLTRIVIALDPAVTASETSDETGIIVAGLGADSHAYILEDLSGRFSPAAWAQIAVEAYHRWKADRIVAETNKGGDLVEKIIRNVDPTVSYQGVHASRGKITRAEPVAALYEQGKIFHAHRGLEQLETQLCTYTGQTSTKSPDRLDALVWALTALMVNRTASPSKAWRV